MQLQPKFNILTKFRKTLKQQVSRKSLPGIFELLRRNTSLILTPGTIGPYKLDSGDQVMGSSYYM
jgi:hypothetical protein